MSHTNPLHALKSLEGIFKANYALVTAPSLTVLASIPVTLVGFTVNKISGPTFSIVDGTTAGGAQIFEAVAGQPIGSYTYDIVLNSGLSVIATNAGLPPAITVRYKI